MALHNAEINLIDGCAVSMGEGFFLVCQLDEYGVAQSVGLSADDLRAMLAAVDAI